MGRGDFMLIQEKFCENHRIDKSMVPDINETTHYICGYGYITRQTYAKEKKTFFNSSLYSIIYCLEGTSAYIDANTGKEYNVYPGCIMQRMPNTPHYHILPSNLKWKEFYFKGSGEIYNYLKQIGSVSDEPVFYLGTDEEIHEKFINYASMMDKTELFRLPELVPEFIKLILYIYSLKKFGPNKNWAYEVSQIISENINVGISLEEIALKCNMKYDVLRKQFKKVFGYSLEKYRIYLRLIEAKKLLANKDMSIKDVALTLGYCDAYAFSKQFARFEGITPGKYRKTL